MLLYNTTYHIEEETETTFLIWIKESYIQEVNKMEMLKNHRLCKILSHRDGNSVAYSLQWEVDNSGILHQWHTQQGAKLNEELSAIFKDKVIGIPTLLEVIE